jgi:hypothetical protein
MKIVRMALVAALILVVVGCGGNKKMKAPNGGKLAVPSWYLDPPVDDDRLIGVATATSLDLQTAIDKAKQDGRAEIARQLDLRITGMSKQFVEETGLDSDAELLGMFTQVSRSVISDSLTGSRIAKQEVGTEQGTYRAWVMMEMPIGEANARFVEKIKSQERLYTRFRATQAFEELDRMVEEYEQWKKEQASAMGR